MQRSGVERCIVSKLQAYANGRRQRVDLNRVKKMHPLEKRIFFVLKVILFFKKINIHSLYVQVNVYFLPFCKHIFNKYSVSSEWIVNKNVSYSTYKFSVLDNG